MSTSAIAPSAQAAPAAPARFAKHAAFGRELFSAVLLAFADEETATESVTSPVAPQEAAEERRGFIDLDRAIGGAKGDAQDDDEEASTDATGLSHSSANFSQLSQSGSSDNLGGGSALAPVEEAPAIDEAAEERDGDAAPAEAEAQDGAGEAAPEGGGALAAADPAPAPATPMELAQDLREEFVALAANTTPANRAYLERLAQCAAESAAKGYGIKRKTHTVRRTRVHKTTNTTDLRTMSTTRKTEEMTKIEEWEEEGSAAMTGVGVVCARGRRCLEKFTDGTENVVNEAVKGKAVFWLGGNSASMCTSTTTFDFEHSRGNGATSGVVRPSALMN